MDALAKARANLDLQDGNGRSGAHPFRAAFLVVLQGVSSVDAHGLFSPGH